MKAVDLLRTAGRALKANTARSILTMLGIIIGVGSVVLMTGVGKSMEGVILGQISSLGSRSMVIFPGGGPEGGEAFVKAGYDSLTLSDLDALEKLSTITSLSPVMFVQGEVKAGRERSIATVLGARPTYFRNVSVSASEGRVLNEQDIEAARSVAVLGPDVVEDLFPGGSALGKRIAIGDRSFEVVGILNPVGSQFFQNVDDRLFIPLTTARAITGQKYLNLITMQATKGFALAFDEVKSVLRYRHGIVNPTNDPDKDDFVVRSSQQANAILSTVSIALTLFITFVAGISLLVGGIGIMNIMLVAVTERTREIGLRKALGARSRDVLAQFLIEAMLLTFVGGVIGMVLGVFLAYLAAQIVHRFLVAYVFSLSLPAIALALCVAAGTGLIFGVTPARRAAALKPIDALRYE